MSRCVLLLPVGLLLGLGLTVPAPPLRAAAPASPPCNALALSPDFPRDRTALCAAQERGAPGTGTRGPVSQRNGPIVTYLTTDGGKTWRRTGGSGLPGTTTTHVHTTLTQVAFSSLFRVDRALYVWAASDGLYKSTDAGETWLKSYVPLSGDPGTGWLTPLAVWSGRVDPPEQLGQTSQNHLVGGFAYAFHNTICTQAGRRAPTDAIVHFPTITPASGASCAASLQYLVPRRWPDASALLLANELPPARTGSVHRCTAVLACPDVVLLDAAHHVVQGWSDPVADATHYIEMRGRSGSIIKRTTDGGATWHTWSAAQRLLSGRGASAVSLAVTDRGATLFIWGRLTPPESGTRETSYGLRVYDSRNGGASWSLKAVQPLSGEPGRGSLPFDTSTGYALSRGAVLRADDRLFTLAARGRGRPAVWCSRDAGRSWRQSC